MGAHISMAKQEAITGKKLSPSSEQKTLPIRSSLPSPFFRQIGNQGIKRLMQPSEDTESEAQAQPGNQLAGTKGDLTGILPVMRQQYGISEPEDPAEQEASRVASQIVSMQPVEEPPDEARGNDYAKVWRSPTIHTQPHTGQGTHQSAELDLPTGDGQPLDGTVAAYMEPRFGYSFQEARIHTSPQSAELSADLGARAFTVGNDIYFGHQEYNPATRQGKELIAHELTHVAQQGYAKPMSGRTISRTKKGEATKTLTLNITKLDGASRSTDVSDASTILENAANIKIAAGKVETLDKTKSEALIGTDLILDEFTSAGSPTAEETALTAVNRTASTITAYFVKSLSGGSHGEAFYPADFPSTPASVAIKDADSPFVAGKPLAHELGHVLLDKGTHPSDAAFLMSYSHAGVGLDATDRTTVRGSSFVK